MHGSGAAVFYDLAVTEGECTMTKTKSFLVILILATTIILAGCFGVVTPTPERSEVIRLTPSRVNAYTNPAVIESVGELNSDAMSLKSDDRIWVIVQTKGKSVSDIYLDGKITGKFSDYALTDEAVEAASRLVERQKEIMALMKILDSDIEFSHSYTSLLSGFAAEIRYGDIREIEALPDVERVIISEKYAQSDASFEDIAEMMNDSGIFASHPDYKGDGMLIAVLDNGLDYNHSAFQVMPEKQNLTYSDVEKTLNGIWGVSSLGESFTADNIYKSAKIPFQFDYADRDADVLTDSTSINYFSTFHGTHVSGIAVGNDENIRGSAPNAQLAFMKVFGDYSGGAETVDIIAALGDCAYLGVDALNMSLGSTAGFTYERNADLFFVNEMYSKLEKLGILVCCASGNETNTSLTYADGFIYSGNPDSGLISSPGSYDAAYAIASVDRVPTGIFYADGSAVTYRPAVAPAESEGFDVMGMILGEETRRELELVVVPGFGQVDDYEGLDVTGKAVLVTRGEISFEEKQAIASEKGAVLCIIRNNEAGIINAQITDLVIPTITVQQIDGKRLENTTKVVFEKDLSVNIISSFSSWGPLSDLKLKPDITAPGGSIYSAMPKGYSGGSYAYLSGTSMASPNLTGLIATVKQYVKERFPAATELEVRNLCYRLVQSTAVQTLDAGGNLASPRAQGAGIADVKRAIETDAYLWVTGSSRTKLELGDDKNRDGVYTLRFNVTNFGDNTLSYRPEVSSFTETLNDNGTLALRSYPLDKGTVKVSSDAISNGVIILEAGETASVTIVITLSDDEKQYLDNGFENGMYVEGFAFLRAENGTDIDLSIPFLGFYGDWTDAPIFDVTAYDNKEPAVYGSTVYGIFGRYDQYYPMGTYSFFTPENPDEEVPEASYDRIALTCDEDGVGSIYAIYLADFRNISYMEYNLTDEETGYTYFTYHDYNVRKMYYNASSQQIVVAGHDLNIGDLLETYDFSSNQRLILSVDAYLDTEGKNSHRRLEFPIYLDFEKPVLEKAEIREENDRILVDMDVYDNHILDNLLLGTPGEDSEELSLLTNFALPVNNFVQGQINTITLDVTDYIPGMKDGQFYVAFSDCAQNQSIYHIGDFSGYIRTENASDEMNGIPDKYDFDAIRNRLESERGIRFDKGEPEDVIRTYVLSEIEALTYKAVPSSQVNSVYESGEHKFTVNDNGELVRYEGPGGYVVIPEDIGITSILGTVDVFRARKDITGVTIPQGVETLGNTCFYQCSALKSVSLPTTLKNYGAHCFRASGLVECDIPEGGETFGSSIFCECPDLERVTFPSTSKGVFPTQAIAFSPKIKEFYMPDGFTSVGSQPVIRCEGLEKLRLSPNLTKLANYFAHGCLSLTEVNFVEMTKITEWNLSCFSWCDLRNVELPANENGAVVAMGSESFNNNLNIEHFTCRADINRFYFVMDYTPELKTIDFYGNIDGAIDGSQFTSAHNLEYVNFYGDVKVIGSNYWPEFSFSDCGMKSVHFYGNVGEIIGTNFSNCPNLSEVVFHKNIGKINHFPFGGCPNLKNFTVSEDNEYLIFDEETKIVYDNEKTKMFVPSGWDYDGILEIPDTVTTLENGQFGSSQASLEGQTFTYSIGENVITSSLSSWHPPLENEVKPLLKGVVIPESIKNIPMYAFKGFTGLKSIEFKGNIEEINDYAFYKCGFEEITIPDAVTYIGNYAFYGCKNLTKVVIGDNLEIIDTYAFAECGNLKNVNLPESLTAVKNYAFMNTSLESIKIPESAAIFNPLTVLYGVKTFKEIAVAEGNPILSAKENVLYNKDETILYKYNSAGDRREFIVPLSVTEIIEYAFEMAGSLEKIDFSDVCEIGRYAFFRSGLKEINLTDRIRFIGTHAFAEMNVEKLTIASGTNIFDYSYVFRNTAITDIAVNKNEFFKVEGDFVMNTRGNVIYDYIGDEIETLVIPEGITKIAPYAFKNAKITNLELPSTLKSIGAEAFFGCGLETVTFRSETAPRFECEYNAEKTMFYANFGEFDIETKPSIKAIFPENATYLRNYIFRFMFAIEK